MPQNDYWHENTKNLIENMKNSYFHNLAGNTSEVYEANLDNPYDYSKTVLKLCG